MRSAIILVPLAVVAVVAGGGATRFPNEAVRSTLAGSTASRASLDWSDLNREYGMRVKVGEGSARGYVLYDQETGAPTEIGVALDERAMQGLPAPNPHHAPPGANPHEHLDNHVYLLSLPVRGAAPYQFVELDWNPGGHEPPGVYDLPHFDFHFWTASPAERASVVPSNPQYQQNAELLPPEPQRPPSFAVAAPPGAPAPAVPLMGVHWADVRAPELQKELGNPAGYRPFTTTFLYGSWAGRFVFLEPMITRAHIMAKKTATDPAVRDEIIPIPAPAQVGTPGYYPKAYRITWDAGAKEYRIALTQLVFRE
jgi:hypothetical protein